MGYLGFDAMNNIDELIYRAIAAPVGIAIRTTNHSATQSAIRAAQARLCDAQIDGLRCAQSPDASDEMWLYHSVMQP